MSPTKSYVIVTPVFNDWECFKQLVKDIRASTREFPPLAIICVNDASTEAGPMGSDLSDYGIDIIFLELKVNKGHQFSIMCGLRHANLSYTDSSVLVMDSDGEDLPSEINKLLSQSELHPDCVITADRGKRYEGPKFSFFHKIYKFVFWIISGKKISFGNFMLIPDHTVPRLIWLDDSWNHLAASIEHHRIKTSGIQIDRGRRYSGFSKMNLVGLVNHGLAAMSVFASTIFVRLLLFFTAVLVASSLLGLLVLYLRFFTNFGVPGWATTALGVQLILSFQAVTVFATTTILMITSRKVIRQPSFLEAEKYYS